MSRYIRPLFLGYLMGYEELDSTILAEKLKRIALATPIREVSRMKLCELQVEFPKATEYE